MTVNKDFHTPQMEAIASMTTNVQIMSLPVGKMEDVLIQKDHIGLLLDINEIHIKIDP